MSTLRRKIFGDLRANAGNFLAVWVTVVIGLAFFGSTYPAGVSMIDSVFAIYDQLHFADFNARFDPAPRQEVLEAVAQVEGVAGVEGRLVVETGLELHAPDRIILRLHSIPADNHPAVNDMLIREGDEITAPDQLLLLQSFADFHDIHPGDRLHVLVDEQPHDLVVAGLVFSPEFIIAGRDAAMPIPQFETFGAAFLRYDDLAALLGQEGVINDVVLTVDPDADIDQDTIRTALEPVMDSAAIEAVFSQEQTISGGVMTSVMDGNMPVSAFFSIMFLLVSGLVMAVLLARLMDAERRRIGTMRALGLGRMEVLRHYLAFPLLIGVTGVIAGSVLGYLLSFFVAHFAIQTTGGELPTFVNKLQWAYILLGAGVTILLALLSGALTTWRASGTDPGLALRPITPKGMGAHGRVAIPGLPLSIRQALRNMLRVPARTVNTLLGVLIGFTVIISSSGTADSTIRYITIQFHEGRQFDLQVIWANPAPSETLLAQVADLPGVSRVEMALAGPVTAQFSERTMDTYAVSVDHETDYFFFETIDGETAFTRDDAVWIGHNLARILDVGTGDDLTIGLLGQSQEVRIAGVVNQGTGSPIFAPAALMAGYMPLGIPLSNMALVRVTPGELDQTRRAIATLDGVITVEDVAQTFRTVQSFYGFWVDFSYIFQGFGYLLTLVVLFTTVSINLRERREELAIMRAMGSSMGEIARVITWETMSVTVFGMILALPMGWVSLGVLLSNYQTDFFGMLSHITLGSYLIAIVGIIVVVLLAEWINLRGIRKVDLGQLSKSLSS